MHGATMVSPESGDCRKESALHSIQLARSQVQSGASPRRTMVLYVGKPVCGRPHTLSDPLVDLYLMPQMYQEILRA